MRQDSSGSVGSPVHADDLLVGDAWELGSYTVTEDEIVTFASSWDPQFFHVDVERAGTEGHLGGLIASGVHTLAIYQRLSVLSRVDTWEVIGGAGIERLRFRRPVRPGDTLTGRQVVEDVRLEHARGRGLVTFGGELHNQDGECVLTVSLAAYLLARPA